MHLPAQSWFSGFLTYCLFSLIDCFDLINTTWSWRGCAFVRSLFIQSASINCHISKEMGRKYFYWKLSEWEDHLSSSTVAILTPISFRLQDYHHESKCFFCCGRRQSAQSGNRTRSPSLTFLTGITVGSAVAKTKVSIDFSQISNDQQHREKKLHYLFI